MINILSTIQSAPIGWNSMIFPAFMYCEVRTWYPQQEALIRMVVACGAAQDDRAGQTDMQTKWRGEGSRGRAARASASFLGAQSSSRLAAATAGSLAMSTLSKM